MKFIFRNLVFIVYKRGRFFKDKFVRDKLWEIYYIYCVESLCWFVFIIFILCKFIIVLRVFLVLIVNFKIMLKFLVLVVIEN